ncbi:hypothetical protein [Paenibacillus spongiae]|uniref:Uncharacterized protein n=1 Tax=Paenibacillus spongiae TaxID=2909671 RepID=A0ABY5S6F4_9BACL|nr:hypothetical protein [Paenibacillus spongiae]UVI29491.1 hypothetical protein L1F29_29410 [Paenibacillus spongiae]
MAASDSQTEAITESLKKYYELESIIRSIKIILEDNPDLETIKECLAAFVEAGEQILEEPQ